MTYGDEPLIFGRHHCRIQQFQMIHRNCNGETTKKHNNNWTVNNTACIFMHRFYIYIYYLANLIYKSKHIHITYILYINVLKIYTHIIQSLRWAQLIPQQLQVVYLYCLPSEARQFIEDRWKQSPNWERVQSIMDDSQQAWNDQILTLTCPKPSEPIPHSAMNLHSSVPVLSCPV